MWRQAFTAEHLPLAYLLLFTICPIANGLLQRKEMLKLDISSSVLLTCTLQLVHWVSRQPSIVARDNSTWPVISLMQ